PDAAFRLLALLSARRRAGQRHHGDHLQGCHPFRRPAGGGDRDPLHLPGTGNLAAGDDLSVRRKKPGTTAGLLLGSRTDQILKYFSRACMKAPSVPSVRVRTMLSASMKLSVVFLVSASPESRNSPRISAAALAPASRISSGKGRTFTPWSFTSVRRARGSLA